MKKKTIEKTAPVQPKGRKTKWQQTIQKVEDILVINSWYEKKLVARHCVNVATRDFATYKRGIWYDTKVEDCIDMGIQVYSAAYWSGYQYEDIKKERWNLRKEDKERIMELMDPWKSKWRQQDSLSIIAEAETDYLRDLRENKEQRRQRRVEEMMSRIPPLPIDWQDWIDDMLAHGRDYLIKAKATKDWHCSACGGTIPELQGEKNARDGQDFECPLCGKKVILRKRKRTIEIRDRAHLIQPIDDNVSVARHFSVSVEFFPVEGARKEISWEEEVRLILNKDPKAKCACDIYWRQWSGFDNKGNPTNRRILRCYLYDGGIEEAFRCTEYEPFTRLFGELAVARMHLDYNNMMIGSQDERFVGMMEMLFRGRFHRLMSEESDMISVWNYQYNGLLELNGTDAGQVLGIHDKQKVNRLRDRDGGRHMLVWMRWADEYLQKVSDEELIWLERNSVWPSTLGLMDEHMTLTQIVNYVKRQQRESYPGMRGDKVIEQWNDYLTMCKRLKKNLDDEMVYRPRELKRRHDEAVNEIAMREAEIQANEYSERYGEAEAVLQKIREKFEYAGKTFRIIVPLRIVDIVKEGRALHHCAGATDRYFDRIKQNETYICFLRKNEAPENPFYTIEVEPGGTIRQHRGMFDEEPEIETVKPFLREWQKVIRKRMQKEDHELAAVSKEKREANIEELKAKNNTRVLQGLMEDFMEAM